MGFTPYICCFFYIVFAKSQLWNIFLVWPDLFQTPLSFAHPSEGIFDFYRKRDKDRVLIAEKSLLKGRKIPSTNKTHLRKKYYKELFHAWISKLAHTFSPPHAPAASTNTQAL